MIHDQPKSLCFVHDCANSVEVLDGAVQKKNQERKNLDDCHAFAVLPHVTNATSASLYFRCFPRYESFIKFL